ncbi:MAG: hypothetical protein H7322_15690 [Ramlibacter sp.]|nr:hypothetical protein [Ramlibacter sp.]
MDESDRTASLMSPARLAQLKPRAATTPAAWLTQMAADAGHMHVKRIAELGELLQAQARAPGLAAVVTRLEELAEALPKLDFSLLEPQGWWARTSGKSKTSGGEFATQFEQIDEEAVDLAKAAGTLPAVGQADTALIERALAELDVECRAVEKIIDQGARWLQDMRNQIKVRQVNVIDPQEQRAILDDSVRCDILVDRLKMLRTLCNAVSPAAEQARASGARRAALVQSLQQSLASEMKDWRNALAAAAAAAAGGKAPAQGVHGPLEAHKDLQASVRKALSGCEQLLTQEQGLVRSLAALGSSQLPA